MKVYQVVIGKIASKELKKLPKREVQRIFPKIQDLLSESLWRIRAGDYQVIYSIDDNIKIVDIRRVGHRRDIYSK